jgi:hypothetical protein
VEFAKFAKQYEHFNRAFYAPKTEVSIADDAVEHYTELRYRIKLNAIKHHGTPITSVLAKHEGLLCVYAYLYEFLNNEGKPKEITKESLDKAMGLLWWLGECAKYLFKIKDRQRDKDLLTNVSELLLHRHFVSGETQSEWHQKVRMSIPHPGPFYNILKELELHGYIKQVTDRKNSIICHINPEIYLL